MRLLPWDKTRERCRRAGLAVHVEHLEDRMVLNGSQHSALARAVSISGRITNEVTGRGLGGLTVQLFDADGAKAATTKTGPLGRYAFKGEKPGAYVVHVETPKAFVQTSPTFTNIAPVGAYATNPATGQLYTGVSWSYHTGNNNPENGPVGQDGWVTIAPEGNAAFESPINIKGEPTDLSQYLTINYAPATPKAVINNGAQLQTQFTANKADSIELNGVEYDLSQFHAHDTAENEVNGYHYPMEEHFVNVSSTGAETVVAVFLQLGAHNDSIQPILDAATANLTTSGSSTTLSAPLNFAGLLPSSTQGWFYSGSLTTPPLSQTVNWLVFSTPITLDSAQLKQYEAVASGAGFLPNNREIQPTDGRQVDQFNIDVAYAGATVGGADFTLARKAALKAVSPATATHSTSSNA
ncbi:carbonic anhydrase family protein [Isosphaeraceae bacterium EP7]